MGRRAVRMIALSLLSALGAIAPAPPAAAPAPPESRPRDPIVSRLERLDPSRPFDYLELAETVHASARSGEDRRLARDLYGLAGALDPAALGASAALGQAALAESAIDRSRLIRIAAALGGSTRRESDSRDPSAAQMRFVQLLGAYRRGDGSRARDLVNSGDVAPIVETYGAIFEGGAAGFRNAVTALRDRPLDSESRRLDSMFLEQSLLSSGRSFASDLIRSNGEALAACDPLDPGPELGVDRTKAWWRDGRWVAPSAP